MADTDVETLQNGTASLSLEEEERLKQRPADIDADVREMERRKRVEALMSSKLFREELERVLDQQIHEGGDAPLLQRIREMVGGRLHSGSLRGPTCVLPINDIRGIEGVGYEKGEKILRCKLAAVYRLVDLFGWTQTGVNGQITARLNTAVESVLTTPRGLLPHEVTASSLVKVDMQGIVQDQGTTNFPVNVEGFSLHAAVHAARPDIRCVLHVRSGSALAVSCMAGGLLPLCHEAAALGDCVVHRVPLGILDNEEKDKLVRALGPSSKILILVNSGALCCGATLEEAFQHARLLTAAADVQLRLSSIPLDRLALIDDVTRRQIFEAAHKAPNDQGKWRVGGEEFEALMRMLDNAGFRTGYIYRHPLIKNDVPKPKNDVEVPPAVSSLGYLLEEEELYKQGLWKKGQGKTGERTRWLNSPNVYQKVEVLETGTHDPKKITKWVDANNDEWVQEGSPAHSSTPVKIDTLQFVPMKTNPKEFKKLQQQIKENRRADKISAGPQSHILEGVTWDEASRLVGEDAVNTQTGDHVVLMGAASKGIIQRGYQHNATMYSAPYARNPFDHVTDNEIEDYKRAVERKTRNDYDTDLSESEAISHQITSPASAPSETEEESRDEHRVLRIETTQAPVRSQPEVVLSDVDTTDFLNAERSHADRTKDTRDPILSDDDVFLPSPRGPIVSRAHHRDPSLLSESEVFLDSAASASSSTGLMSPLVSPMPQRAPVHVVIRSSTAAVARSVRGEENEPLTASKRTLHEYSRNSNIDNLIKVYNSPENDVKHPRCKLSLNNKLDAIEHSGSRSSLSSIPSIEWDGRCKSEYALRTKSLPRQRVSSLSKLYRTRSHSGFINSFMKDPEPLHYHLPRCQSCGTFSDHSMKDPIANKGMPTSLYLSVDNIHQKCMDEIEKVKVKEAVIPAYKVANAPEFVESQEFNEDNYLGELNSFASNNQTVIEKALDKTAKDIEVTRDDNSDTYRADYAQIDTDNDNTLETTEGEYLSFTEDFEEAYESPVKDLVEKDIRDYSVPIDFYCDDYNRSSEDSPKKSPFKGDRKHSESPIKSPFKARESLNVLEPILEESKSSYGDDSGNLSEKRDSDAYLSAEIKIDGSGTNFQTKHDIVEKKIETDTGIAELHSNNKDSVPQIDDRLVVKMMRDDSEATIIYVQSNKDAFVKNQKTDADYTENAYSFVETPEQQIEKHSITGRDDFEATDYNVTEFESNDGTDVKDERETNATSAATANLRDKDDVKQIYDSSNSDTIIDILPAAITELHSNDGNVQCCDSHVLEVKPDRNTETSVNDDVKNEEQIKGRMTVDIMTYEVLGEELNTVILYDDALANPENTETHEKIDIHREEKLDDNLIEGAPTDDVLETKATELQSFTNVFDGIPKKDTNEPVNDDNLIKGATTDDVLDSKATEPQSYTNVFDGIPENDTNEPVNEADDDATYKKDIEKKSNDHFIASSTDGVMTDNQNDNYSHDNEDITINVHKNAFFEPYEEEKDDKLFTGISPDVALHAPVHGQSNEYRDPCVVNPTTDIEKNELNVDSGDKDFPQNPHASELIEESKSSYGNFSEKQDSKVVEITGELTRETYVQPNDFTDVHVVQQKKLVRDDDKLKIDNVSCDKTPEEKNDELLTKTLNITRYVDNDVRIDNEDARKSSIEYSVSSFVTMSFNSTIEFEKYEAIADLLSNLLDKIDYDGIKRDFFNATENKRTKVFFDDLDVNYKQSQVNENDSERMSDEINCKPVIENEMAQSFKNNDLPEQENEELFSITKMIQEIEKTVNLNETILTDTSDSFTEPFKVAESLLYYIFDRVFVDKKNKNKKRNNKKVVTVVDAEDIILTAVNLWPDHDENYYLTTDSYNHEFNIESNMCDDANIEEDINSHHGKVQNNTDKNGFHAEQDVNLENETSKEHASQQKQSCFDYKLDRNYVQSIDEKSKSNIEIQLRLSADIKPEGNTIAVEHKVVQGCKAADQIDFELKINIESTNVPHYENDRAELGNQTVSQNVLHGNNIAKNWYKDKILQAGTVEEWKENVMCTDVSDEQNENWFQEKYEEETQFEINEESLHHQSTETLTDHQMKYNGEKYDEETNVESDQEPTHDSNVMDHFDYSVPTFRESDIEIVLNNPKEIQHTKKYHEDDYSTTDDEECKELSDYSIEIADDIVFEILDHALQSRNKTFTQNDQNYPTCDKNLANATNHDDVQAFEKIYVDPETYYKVGHNTDLDKTYNVKTKEITNFQPPNKPDFDQEIEGCTNETLVDNDKMNTAFVHDVFCSHASSPRKNLRDFETCDESPIRKPSTSFVGQDLSLYNKDDTLLGSPFVKQAAVISMSLTENSGGIKYWLSFDDSITENNGSFASFGRRSLRNTDDVIPSFYGVDFEKKDEKMQRSVLVNDIDESVETALLDKYRVDVSIEFPNFSSSNTSHFYDTCESNDDSPMKKLDSPQNMPTLPEHLYDIDNSERKLLYEVQRRERLYTTWPPFEDTLFYKIISKFRMSESFDSSELDRARIDSL